ncbi:MAG: hypothetical protein NC340_01490 [Ruminococcus flavefaciens]|nr:hypothetical protein [Ruminococcus flavefaciens]MCM1228820.1 hypothetical protein [Ruminococcus flavefaciens]
MKVTLVTASFNDTVHGTVNDKKTGCGINLMKPDTASRYHKSGEMTYLGEITCEKCKAKIAKEMIKADSKEMKALLKEEKMRAKKGLDDGLVQLSELEVRPTSVAEPEPVEPEKPAVPTDNIQVNADNPAYSDDLAQFAIKKPVQPEPQPVQEEPEDDFLAQFAVNKPEAPAPVAEEPEEDDFLSQFTINKPEAPAPVAEEPEEDDFLAQFAVNTPQETPAPVAEEPEDDFLAQFSVSSDSQNTAYEEEPESPPVIDDISEALASIQNSPINSFQKEPQDSTDDILSMFSIDKTPQNEEINTSTSYISSSIIDDDDDDESIFDAMLSDDEETDLSNASEWDVIANQLFGDISEEKLAPPVLEDIKIPVVEEVSAPVIEDIEIPTVEEVSAPVIKDIEIPTVEEISAPVIEDIEIPVVEEISAPVIEDIEIPAVEEISAPVIEDIEIPTVEEVSAPVIEDIEIPAVEEAPAPVIEDIKIPTVEEVSAPVIEEIKIPAVEEAPAPVVEEAPAPKPVTVPPVAPVQQTVAPPPVQPVQQPVAPPPVQPIPQPVMPPPVAPVQPMPGMGIGQIMTVPQVTGYDQNGQPVYTYMQMLFQGYDQNGQPIMMPIPAQSMPMGMRFGMPMPAMTVPPVAPVAPVQPAQPEYSSLSKNSRLQAVLDSLDEPVDEKNMTIGQKIAAAEAAKGSPVTANVSKIATNPHTRSTSQAFISAISESKEATQSLTETQGLKPKTMVLDSIEDVLSQLGDNSLKEKKEAEAKMQRNVPVYEEFKTPSRTSSSSFSRPVPSSKTSSSNMMDVPLTKAQQKELKKQQKIDAKFQKEMAKRKK